MYICTVDTIDFLHTGRRLRDLHVGICRTASMDHRRRRQAPAAVAAADDDGGGGGG